MTAVSRICRAAVGRMRLARACVYQNQCQNGRRTLFSPSLAGFAPGGTNRGRGNNRTGPTKPDPGARRAFKKTVNLKNDNAAEVQLDVVGRDDLAKVENVGRMMELDARTVSFLSHNNSFKPSQAWRFFRKVSVLVRPETVDLVGRLDEAAESKQTIRTVVAGPAGSGKSVLLAQALAHAHLNGWFVVMIPEARDIVLNRTEYSQIPGSDPAVYQQIRWLGQTLRSLRTRYMSILAGLPVVKLDELSDPFRRRLIEYESRNGKSGDGRETPTLLDLVDLGMEGTLSNSWEAFRALIREMSLPNTGSETVPRPPMLVTVDGLAHLMADSDYLTTTTMTTTSEWDSGTVKTQTVNRIHAHDLAQVRHFIALLSGQNDRFCNVSDSGFGNGGGVIAAMCGSGTTVSKSLQFGLDRARSFQQSGEVPVWNGYHAADSRVIEAINPEKTTVMDLSGLSFDLTSQLIKYYVDSGLVAFPADGGREHGFLRLHHTLSAGIPAQLERHLLKEVRPPV